ncbi:isoaspartyl peptidase/L-asparaginase family protein [Burkholderia ubonensis]|uniref:Isoaspartyl peptidase n=1 Tax=Burkholderia ubonensis subsp. mesacidophila TaxID=265293 RepID=A0A2A4FAU8_9BURK|nr:isoaspartyl peptidase/L-asparaginase [Burkholderia ubonensis]PCE29479.1 beta-aspartyl-peptidase [Burkholderia ubonensis subsp. mesacidophila]
MAQYILAIHGGAGTLQRGAMTPEQEAAHRAALEEALAAGQQVLQAGGSSVDAAVAAVVSLENCPLFNAGRGSVFTHAGTHEMDAAVMEGHTGRAGAVAGVSRIRNPVEAARRVMERSTHVLLSGPGAEQFATGEGLALEPPEYFHTDFRWQQLLAVRDTGRALLDHDGTTLLHEKPHSDASRLINGEHKFGTVGAVALDANGHLAAATSTGGLTNKRHGRIGDSPLIGCGTFADARVAVSATGTGEAFIRAVAAHDVAARMKYGHATVDEAARAVVDEMIPQQRGSGGLIAVDANGRVSMPFNTEGMYRGVIQADGQRYVDIYR